MSTTIRESVARSLPSASELRAEQEATLAQDRMPAGFAARALFRLIDVVYGSDASLPKFRVLEVVARVPYIAWEQVAYVAITHTHSTPRFAREIHTEVTSYRSQQDNELFHLLILEELLQRHGHRQALLRYRVIPQILAWCFYQISWLLYVIRPSWSFALNAQFEDHAEHEYMQFVADHPHLEQEPWESQFAEDYGEFASVADVLRQIALDERHHKLESVAKLPSARFGAETKLQRGNE